MKKAISLLFAVVLLVGLSACGGSSSEKECKVTTILITDTSGINDKSFNQGAYEGLERFAKENDGACNAKSVQSPNQSANVSTIESVSGKKNDLVVAAGFTFADPILASAKKTPNQKYLIIDTEVKADNVISADFAANEGSFLAGVAAAEKAKAANKTKVGFIGGMTGPVIKGFEVGFVQGVKAVDSNIKVDVNYLGTFDDTTKGKTVATQMFNSGDYVIFVAAGNAGNGVIDAAKGMVRDQSKDVWVIGVDRDQYDDGKFGDKSVILTSMVKRADLATEKVAKMVLDGTYKGGQTLRFTLKDGAVGLPENNPNLSDDIIKVVNQYKDKIISGEITVANK